MNEHSPIRPDGDPADHDEARSSLIERATRAMDLGILRPRPVPDAIRAPARPAGLPAAEPAVPAVPAEIQPAKDSQTEPRAVPVPPATPAQAVPPAQVQPGPRHQIDREKLREQGLIVPEGAVTTLLEEFRIVKRQLLVQAMDLRRQDAGPMAQRILVTSPLPGEGKTYCALNLALAIAAERESEVLLVDADFAKPSVLSALDLPGGPGLMDALMDPSRDVLGCILDTDIPGLRVLPAGEGTSADSEYLGSSRAVEVLDRLTEGAPNRIVIFDSPPVLAASPAAELAKYAGQTIVIVRADATGQGALDDAVTLLGACPNLQLLLNAAQFSPSGRRFGAYYGYKG